MHGYSKCSGYSNVYCAPAHGAQGVCHVLRLNYTHPVDHQSIIIIPMAYGCQQRGNSSTHAKCHPDRGFLKTRA